MPACVRQFATSTGDKISQRSRSPDWIKVKNPKHPSIERVKEAFS
jgi:hypothetical protein